jgi:hypothetical protein
MARRALGIAARLEREHCINTNANKDVKRRWIFTWFDLFFWFEDGAWCWLRPHQEALRCFISIGLLLFLNRKTEKTFFLFVQASSVGWV